MKQRITLLTMKLIHKICLGNAPEYLKKYVIKRGDTHMYSLRNDNNLNTLPSKLGSTLDVLLIANRFWFIYVVPK